MFVKLIVVSKGQKCVHFSMLVTLFRATGFISIQILNQREKEM